MTQALQLLVCCAVAIVIALVSLLVDRWENSRKGINDPPSTGVSQDQDSFEFSGAAYSREEEPARPSAAMSRIR